MTEDSVPVFDYFFFLHILFQIIQDILTGSQFFWRNSSQVYSDSDCQRRDKLNCVHRWMPELIQEVVELTGNLWFLFCSTPIWVLEMLHYIVNTNTWTNIFKTTSRSAPRLHGRADDIFIFAGKARVTNVRGECFSLSSSFLNINKIFE